MAFRLICLSLMVVLLLACDDTEEGGSLTATAVLPEPTATQVDVKTATAIAKPDDDGVAVPTATAIANESVENVTDMATATTVVPDSVWGMRAPLLEPNSETAVAQLGNQIYVIGGYPSSRSSVSTVQIYDVVLNSWSLASPLPRPVNHAMAAAVQDKVYVIGGQSSASGEGPFLDGVFVYDPATDSWTTGALMPTGRSGGTAVVIDDKIYVAGGRPPHGHDFAVYDPLENSWQTLPDMPTARNHVAGGAIGGKLYVVGGRFGAGFQSEMTDVLEVYDPVTNMWTMAAPMPTVRGGLNAAAVFGCLHVFGGEGREGVFPQHEVYDPTTDLWYLLDPMPTPVHGVAGAGVVDDRIYLPGGGTGVGGSSGSTLHQVVQVSKQCE